MPAVVDAGAVKAELHAASLTAAEEQVEADRRRHAERLAAFAAAEAAREQDLLIRDGVPMSHWPKHTDGYRRWKAHEDQLAAEHEADRLRRAEEDRLEATREADRRRVEAAGIAELVARWRERETKGYLHAVQTTSEPAKWRSWLRTLLSLPVPAAR
jgi:hypothetical protein